MAVDPGGDSQQETPQTWNKYLYVRDNPLRFTDPTGQLTSNQVEEYGKKMTETGEMISKVGGGVALGGLCLAGPVGAEPGLAMAGAGGALTVGGDIVSTAANYKSGDNWTALAKDTATLVLGKGVEEVAASAAKALSVSGRKAAAFVSTVFEVFSSASGSQSDQQETGGAQPASGASGGGTSRPLQMNPVGGGQPGLTSVDREIQGMRDRANAGPGPRKSSSADKK